MFDIIMIALFTIGSVGVLMYAFKPVWDTMKRDELERELKKKDKTIHPA